MKDLITLVPDKNMEVGLKELFSRYDALGIQRIEFDIFRHPHHDPGVFWEAAQFLSIYTGEYRYALVLFDCEGSGQEQRKATELEDLVQQKLDKKGWQNRSSVIVVDPEFETWVWSDSPHVADVLGVDLTNLRAIIKSNTDPGSFKPKRPKELVETVLRQSKIPRSSALYGELAKKVSLQKCTDPAFRRLKDCLVKWFGAKEEKA